MARPKKQTFMLVSLEEKKAKHLAQVISNDTCRKILDMLAQDKKTATQLSKELNVPLPTVHYNLKALTEAKLVHSKEFHYSEKGREIQHYELTNQYVVIAPAGAEEGWKTKLKSLIPTFATIGGIGLAYSFLKGSFASTARMAEIASAPIPQAVERHAVEAVVDAGGEIVVSSGASAPSMVSAPTVASKAAPLMADDADLVMEAAPEAAEAVVDVATNVVQQPPEVIIQTVQAHPVWAFFVGAVVAIALFFLFDYIRNKLKK
jgi:DNA-binding transcriptional ArsR family regulator